MTSWSRVQGDIDDTITVALGGIADLSTVDAVEAHVWINSTYETLTASVLDADERTIVVELGGAAGWLFDAAVTSWHIEYQVTFLDGSVKTWPEAKPDTIAVRAQGDPPAP